MSSLDVSIPDHIARTVIDPKAYADEKALHDALRWLRNNQPLGMTEIEIGRAHV